MDLSVAHLRTSAVQSTAWLGTPGYSRVFEGTPMVLHGTPGYSRVLPWYSRVLQWYSSTPMVFPWYISRACVTCRTVDSRLQERLVRCALCAAVRALCTAHAWASGWQVRPLALRLSKRRERTSAAMNLSPDFAVEIQPRAVWEGIPNDRTSSLGPTSQTFDRIGSCADRPIDHSVGQTNESASFVRQSQLRSVN